MIDSGPNSLSAVAQSVSYVSLGRSLQAVSLSGTNSSYFQISDITSIGIVNRPFSISLWIRPRSSSGVLLHVSSEANGRGWCIPFIGFTANGSIVTQMQNGAIRFVTGPSIPLSPIWTHIVQTWSPINGLRLYVNNVLVASTMVMATSYTASSLSNYITLGNMLEGVGICPAGAFGSLTPFNGDVDEFRIYAREINADDVCSLYLR